jgi:starch synthase
MDILFCSSEAYPLIKTGGLADVSSSLTKAISKLGNDVRLILPAYSEILHKSGELETVASLSLSGAEQPVTLLKGRFPDSPMAFYLVDSPAHFRRSGNPYVQPDGSDWPDNAARFALFARAVVEVALGRTDGGWQPQLVHCNDWQTGLVPPLLTQYSERPATLFTIHNISYQGLFPAAAFHELQLPDVLWSIDGVEYHNMLSFLKGGIACADWITTVSPTYAEEIRTAEYGYGLEGLLQYRAARLSGILNGMDDSVWDPETDANIARNYNRHTLQYKSLNKAALQRETGLPVNSRALLIGHVGRLVEQKGIDLLLDILDELLVQQVQLVILGSGDERLEQQLRDAAQRHPQQLAVHIGFDEGLAHRIEAGADCFAMPSRYEPCGLNQMYSLRYGTVPIVRNTGGLADSVVDVNNTTARNATATGFVFEEDSAEALLYACLRALARFQPPKVDWWKLVIAGMETDFSWANSASRYMDAYHRARLVMQHGDVEAYPANVKVLRPAGTAAARSRHVSNH